MKKILCPTDFSDSAHDGIAYAAKLAKGTGCSLTLLHANAVSDFSLANATTSNHMSSLAIADQLEQQSSEISKTFKISCDSKVVPKVSNLSSVINNVAKDYDLIVMGSNGTENLYQFFSGSNTYKAIAKSDTPVLLIPEGYMYSEIKTVVYAYDYLRERSLPLARLVPFLKVVNCRLTVLQVMEEAFSQEAEDNLKELQFIIKSNYGDDLNYEHDTIRSADVAQSINSYVLQNEPDVLALCSVHRNLIERIFHKSVIKNISAISSYPVYVFHR